MTTQTGEQRVDLDVRDFTTVGSTHPYCPFCGGVMVESEDRTRLVCVACDCDALLDGGPR